MRTSLASGVVCFVAVIGIGPADATAVSFEDARTALHAVSDLRKSGEAGVERNVYEAKSAESLGLPEVVVNATQVFGVKSGSIATPAGNTGFTENFTGPRASINSVWTIYSGGRITATQRALAAGSDQARAELRGTEEQLDLRLAQVYFAFDLANNVERTRAAILAQADRHLDRAVKFEQRGLVASVERLNAQVSRDQAASELLHAERDREIAQARLQRLLHRAGPLEAATPLFVITGSIGPLSTWIMAADERNPVLAAFSAKREQAKQGIVIAESRWKPEVFAFGSYNFVKHYQTLIEPNWIAGIGVNLTLFSREDRGSKVGAAREALRQIEALEAETRNELDSAVETSYRKVEQARDQFKLLDSTLALARENLRLRERGFEEGQATSLDVNDARNALARAETSRALAAYEFVVALASLLEASGQAHAFPDFIRLADVQLRP